MTRDQNGPSKVPDADDVSRTDEAKRVIEDYRKALLEMLKKLRRLFN